MTTPIDPAHVSDVLCAAWATQSDIPEKYRPLVGDEEWALILMQASEILWALSGRRFYGEGCSETVTLRSVPPQPGKGEWPYHKTWGGCACWASGTWAQGWLWPPSLWEGTHYRPVAIRLPRAPVAAITTVTVDGVPLDASAYELSRSGWLTRTDGGSWAVCGDTTQVTYSYGVPPGAAGVAACVELAVEIAKAYANDGTCQLPQRIQSITRQGISMTVLDPQEFLGEGRTGLYLVDLWLAAVNPLARPRPGRVWSPDLPTAH